MTPKRFEEIKEAHKRASHYRENSRLVSHRHRGELINEVEFLQRRLVDLQVATAIAP